jgi:iron complex outermembrane receptor protein
VVVTAQKRSENLQKVPLAVSVVSADLLKQNAITNAGDLDQLVPSLTFKKGTANVNSTLSIRGIGTQSFSSGAEPSVSTVVDGVVFGRSGMAFQEFTDLDHIEVLEGPQGTLFGKNASAGAINIVTKAPSHVFGGDVSFGDYEGGDYRADANITGPITDRIRFALSGLYDDYRGNIYNAYQKAWTNGDHNLGLRGSIVADITDNLTFTLHADYVHGAENCCADVLGAYVPSAGLTNILLPSIAPVKAYFGSKDVYDNLSPRTEDGNGGVSGQLDYSIDGFTITSITAWRNWRNKQVRDGDFHATSGSYVNSLDINDRDYGALNYNQYSEELRLVSPSNQKLQYVAGAFFWYTDENDWFNRFVDRCYASTLPADATGSQPCSSAPGVSSFTSTALGNDDAPAHWNTKFYNQALFGQSTYALTDKLTLIGGLRLTHDRVQYDLGRTSFAPAGTPGIGSTFQYAEHAEAMGISGKAGAQYQLTPDNMIYATYSRGYKGPSLNDFYSENVGNVGKISPETSNAYEVGAKSQFFDHKLTFNGDFFWEDFSDFQANSFVNLNGVTVVTLKNAGSVRSYGAEFNTNWRATQDLTFVGGYTYDEATIVSYNCPTSIGAANVVTCLLHNGHTLPFAPKNKFNISGAYDVPMPEALPFNVRLNSTYTYTSLINFDIDQTPLAKQPGYGLWDIAATITTKDGRYSLALIGKNLTNQYYTDFITPSGNGIAAGSYTRLQVPRDAQRYVGVRATMNFQ